MIDLELLKTIPESPGVYRFYDRTNLLIYVGQSSNLRTRLRSYRASKTRKKAHLRNRRILKHAHRLEFEVTPTAIDAKLKEDALIKAHRPKLNREGAYFESYPYLGLEYQESEKRLRWILSARRREGPIYFGAFRNRETIEFVFLTVASLLEWAGKSSGPKKRIRTYNHIAPEVFSALVRFFRSANAFELTPLVLYLLERPRARIARARVSEAFQALKTFSENELREHVRVLEYSKTDILEQHARDAAFITARDQDRTI